MKARALLVGVLMISVMVSGCFSNDGASNPSWTASNIATSANGAESVFVADMDNDGDMDIVSASWIDDTIAWYENNAGIPEFSNIMMPIVSVLAIVGFNYRRRKINQALTQEQLLNIDIKIGRASCRERV